MEFSGSPQNNYVNLHWATAAEINNDFFTVQHSKENLYWQTVGTIPGAGNSSGYQQYEMVDKEPFSGISYYRLSQTDFNGAGKVLAMIAVRMNLTNESTIVYPSPADEFLTLNSTGDLSGSKVYIEDIIGKRIWTEAVLPDPFTNQYTINVSSLPSGTYFIRIVNDRNSLVRKFVKR